MSGVEGPTRMAPGDWPTDPERRYANRQDRLARRYGLEAASAVVETDVAGRVHYLTAGDPGAKPVLLLHGITAPAAVWLPMLPALADGYRVHAPDMPGEGLSAKPSYRGRDLRSFLIAYLGDLLDALDVERPHVVANSLGGLQAFLLAIDRDRVDRLCLLGAPVGLSRRFPLPARLLTVPGLNDVLLWAAARADPLDTARAWLRRFGVVDDSAVPDAFYETYAARLELPGIRRSLRSLLSESGSFGRMHPLTDLREAVVGIERPTAFVWGGADYYWSPEVGRPVVDRMADAELYELHEHGHMPWLEPGDRAAGRVRAFLDA